MYASAMMDAALNLTLALTLAARQALWMPRVDLRRLRASFIPSVSPRLIIWSSAPLDIHVQEV